ncbi:hypothetical protein MHYP_G00087060 [Metynnis hypsauchen]
MKSLEIEIVELQNLTESTGNRGNIEALKTKKVILADLLGTKAQGALVRSRFQKVAQMDAPSKFFFSLECKNGQRRCIHALRSESGALLSDPAGIRSHAAKFYVELFSSEYSEQPELEKGFFEGLPKLAEDSASGLERQLSLVELSDALRSMECGKALGIEGLPAEFYKSFWPVIGEDLLEALNDSLAKGRLPSSCRRAVLTLLPKKGDLHELKNWRPVSLLCCDYKLLSKVLAVRLKEVVGQIIHPDQTYCIPRSVFSCFSATFTKLVFILGFKYTQKRRAQCQLINFFLGNAKMAILVMRRSITEGLRDTDPVSVFKRLVKTRILTDFTFHSTNKDLGSFEQIWGGVNSLCSVKDGELNSLELLR